VASERRADGRAGRKRWGEESVLVARMREEVVVAARKRSREAIACVCLKKRLLWDVVVWGRTAKEGRRAKGRRRFHFADEGGCSASVSCIRSRSDPRKY